MGPPGSRGKPGRAGIDGAPGAPGAPGHIIVIPVCTRDCLSLLSHLSKSFIHVSHPSTMNMIHKLLCVQFKE